MSYPTKAYVAEIDAKQKAAKEAGASTEEIAAIYDGAMQFESPAQIREREENYARIHRRTI